MGGGGWKQPHKTSRGRGNGRDPPVPMECHAGLPVDPEQARVLIAIADGRALPAGVLADEAGVGPAATARHLRELIAEGLIEVLVTGRFRYYRLAPPGSALLRAH